MTEIRSPGRFFGNRPVNRWFVIAGSPKPQAAHRRAEGKSGAPR
jgi:hypothetical protein